MKIRASVDAVEDKGDVLMVAVLGKAVGASMWDVDKRHEFYVPLSTTNRRAFYVGRVVEITVVPK